MDKIGNLEEKKFFLKIILTPLERSRADLCECVTSMIFQEKLFFCLAALAGGSPIENLILTFFVFNILVTCDQQQKVLSSQKVLL